jgi:hypothetical protein
MLERALHESAGNRRGLYAATSSILPRYDPDQSIDHALKCRIVQGTGFVEDDSTVRSEQAVRTDITGLLERPLSEV